MNQISASASDGSPPGRVLDQFSALGVALLLLAVTALRYAAWPPVPGNDRATDAAVFAVTLLFAVFTVALGRRLPTLVGLDLPMVVAWGSATLMAATRPLPQGQLLFGFPLVTLAVLAAYFLPARRAVVHVAAMFVAYPVAVLATGDRLASFYAQFVCLTGVITAAAIGHLRRSRDRLLADVERQALLDPLTGALNRRGLETEAPAGHSVASRAGRPTTLVAIDLDGFKMYNDTYGHAAGDALLVNVVREWAQHIRAGDRIARTGGDEFVLVLPGANEHTTEQLLHRMRALSSAQWSAGFAFWHPDETLDEALRQADVALYENKQLKGS